MPTLQEQLADLMNELEGLTHQPYRKNRDELFAVFGFAFQHFGDSFKDQSPSWISLDETVLAALEASTTDSLLDLEIISQLADLLVDEFGLTLTLDDLNHAQHLRDVCRQIRVLLNMAMQRSPDHRLLSRLDQPAVHRHLTFEFDRVLLGPVSEMIAKIEHLLADTSLNELQRQDLETALKSSRRLHRVLLTARPLIETQNFRAMALLSHEYRSPFCGITGFFQLLIKFNNEGLTQDQFDHLYDLVGYSQTILRMVNDLIDAVKLMTGGFKASGTCQPSEVVKRLVDTHAHMPPGIDLQVHIAESLSLVPIDHYCLYQSLSALLDNAIKYTREGCIFITVVQQDACVVFEVKDTGMGIPSDQQQTIFEPFVQVGSQPKGLGLGLYLARQFVQRAGGTLTVQSEEGMGSVLTLTMPLPHQSDAVG